MDHVDKSTTTSSGDPDIDAYLSIKSSGSSTSTTELSNDSVGRTKRRSISLGNLIFELPENWKQIKEEKRRRKEEEDEKKRKSLKKAISQKDKFLGFSFR